MFRRSGWRLLTRRSASALLRGRGEVLTCKSCHAPTFLSASFPSPCCRCRTVSVSATPLSTTPLCIPARSISSAQVSPFSNVPSLAAASAETPVATRRESQKLRIWTPDIMTHESLSYAECPMCGATFHMHNMFFHITAIHQDQDVTYWREQCNARLALYERVVGIPLPRPTAPSNSLDAVMESGTDPFAMKESTYNVPFVDQEAFRCFMPTVTASGTYVCNWCTVKHAPFPTRDSFLLHVAKDHPMMDFDLIESLVQPPPSSPASKAAAAANAENAEQNTQAPSPSTMWTPTGMCSPADADTDVSGVGVRGIDSKLLKPTRRMPGVKTVQQSNVHTVKLQARQCGLSVARSDAARIVPAPLGTAVLPTTPSAGEASGGDAAATVAVQSFFHERHFPCELCLKVFASELNLLQHLENKHAPPPLINCAPSPAAEGGDALFSQAEENPASSFSPSSSVTQPSLPENTAKSSEASSVISVTCDLCHNTSKLFTLPSALFAHIRFRHRNVDPTYEAERMINEQRGKSELRCSRCLKIFPTVRALRDHLWDRHGMDAKAAEMEATNLRSSGAADVPKPSSGGSELAAKYACPTLPPFSMMTRWWCNECERGFRTPNALATHQKGKHMSVTELFPCPACRRVFQDAFTLEDHVKAAHRSVALVDLNLSTSIFCPYCNRGFISYEALHNHSVKHHNKDPHSPVRTIAKPVREPAVAQATMVKPSDADEAAPVIATPTKPRKVSRRKKASSTDA